MPAIHELPASSPIAPESVLKILRRDSNILVLPLLPQFAENPCYTKESERCRPGWWKLLARHACLARRRNPAAKLASPVFGGAVPHSLALTVDLKKR
jgi:hypothetical protein